MFLRSFFVGIIFSVGSSQCIAATVSATASIQNPNGFNCYERNDSVASVTASCEPFNVSFGLYAVGGLSDARAGFGSIGVRSVASTLTPDFIGGGSYVTAAATAWMDDLLSFSIASGSIVIPIDFAGSIFISDQTERGRAQLRLDALVGGAYVNVFDYYWQDGSLLSSTGAVGISELIVPISDGRASVFLSLDALAESSTFRESALAQISLDFFSSARLLGSQVFDSDGNRVDSAFVGSESGFDYLAGVEPHSPSPIPLPGAVWALVLGIGSLVALRSKAA